MSNSGANLGGAFVSRSHYPLTPEMFGAVGDGNAYDGPALQLWLDAISSQGAKGVGFLPGRTYRTDQQLNYTEAGGTIYGTGPQSIIRAFSTIAGTDGAVLNITASGNSRGVYESFYIDANGWAPHCIYHHMSPETSAGSRFSRIQMHGGTSYQMYNSQCEDVSYVGCLVVGDEYSKATLPLAIKVVIPFGTVWFDHCELFGRVDLQYEQVAISSCTIGSITINNPNSRDNTILTIVGSYMYDGNGFSCIEAIDHLTNIVMTGCILYSGDKRVWIKGDILPNVHVKAEECLYKRDSVTGVAGACYIGQGTGSGLFTVSGGLVNLLGGDTVALWNATSGTVLARVTKAVAGLPIPATTKYDFTLAGSPANVYNPYPVPVTAYIWGGTVVSMSNGGSPLGTGGSTAVVRIAPKDLLVVAYTGTPTIRLIPE